MTVAGLVRLIGWRGGAEGGEIFGQRGVKFLSRGW